MSFSTLNSAFEKQIVEDDERETTTQPTTTTRRILRVDESFSTLFCERARTRCPPRETAQLSRTHHLSDRVQQAHTYTHTQSTYSPFTHVAYPCWQPGPTETLSVTVSQHLKPRRGIVTLPRQRSTYSLYWKMKRGIRCLHKIQSTKFNPHFT